MDRRGYVRLLTALTVTTALTGCVPGTSPTGETGGGGLFAAPSPVSVERDIEAPNVFSVNGEGLWDGRPSLGGVWVAHAEVKDPERVMIRNAKNGKSVVGALFRRERDNPGPSIQVSSDAAEALGMLAGQPANLSVVALRREEKPVPPEAEIGLGTDDGVIAAAGAETATATGSDATSAGSEATATATAPKTSPAPAAAPGGSGSADAGVAATEAAVGEAMAEPAPQKKRGFFDFLKKKPKGEPLSAIPDQPVAGSAGAGPIEQNTLDPLTSSAAAAIDRADAAPAPAAAAPASALKRAYIQIGIFSTEANAQKAVGQMTAAGMSAKVVPDQSNGKTYWRVIVGPASSEADRNALVAKVKGIGYPDAYPVSK